MMKHGERKNGELKTPQLSRFIPRLKPLFTNRVLEKERERKRQSPSPCKSGGIYRQKTKPKKNEEFCALILFHESTPPQLMNEILK